MEKEKQGINSWWLIAIGVLGGLLGAAVLMLFNSQPRGKPVSILPPPTAAPIVVQVSGAVAQPDIYSLPPGCRTRDAIDAAGGFLPEAYSDTLNLAAQLEDGDKILVPSLTQGESSNTTNREEPANNSIPMFPVNINTASLEELKLLTDIGDVKAQAIIDYRESNGDFITIEQIQNVPGIGPGIFDKIKELITVGD